MPWPLLPNPPRLRRSALKAWATRKAPDAVAETSRRVHAGLRIESPHHRGSIVLCAAVVACLAWLALWLGGARWEAARLPTGLLLAGLFAVDVLRHALARAGGQRPQRRTGMLHRTPMHAGPRSPFRTMRATALPLAPFAPHRPSNARLAVPRRGTHGGAGAAHSAWRSLARTYDCKRQVTPPKPWGSLRTVGRCHFARASVPCHVLGHTAPNDLLCPHAAARCFLYGRAAPARGLRARASDICPMPQRTHVGSTLRSDFPRLV